MKFYYELKGNKLNGTECRSYQQAKFILFKIIDECIEHYEFAHNRKMNCTEELRFQNKILSKLKLVIH